MKKLIGKYCVSSFYIITLIFSFLLLILHAVFQSVGNYSVSFTQYAPALSVIFISLILRDRTSLVYIKSHLNFYSGYAKWIIPAIAIPSICIAVSALALSYYSIAYIPWEGNALFYALNIAAMLMGCAAEEIGWRGFLLPNLQKRFSPFLSSIIVGALWGIWHLNFIEGIWGFILYDITIIEMSILMTWVFNKSGENLLLMILWHFVFNLTSHILLWERFNIDLYIVQSIVFGILCVIILNIKRYKCDIDKNLNEGI